MPAAQSTFSVIHLAAAYGNAESLRIIIQAGADPNAVTTERWTPLGTALTYRNRATSRYLIEHVHVNLTAPNSFGDDPATVAHTLL